MKIPALCVGRQYQDPDTGTVYECTRVTPTIATIRPMQAVRRTFYDGQGKLKTVNDRKRMDVAPHSIFTDVTKED